MKCFHTVFVANVFCIERNYRHYFRSELAICSLPNDVRNNSSLSGTLTNCFLFKYFSEVNSMKNELVFQPGQFDNDQVSIELERIMRDKHKRTHSFPSLQSHESDSFHTCRDWVD